MNLKSFAYLSLITLITSLGVATHAQTFSVIHTFQGGTDGVLPVAGLTPRGNVFYGTTAGGGVGGTVYQMTHAGSNWTTSPISLLSAFAGYDPQARVVFGPDNHLYGTQYSGGYCNFGNGG